MVVSHFLTTTQVPLRAYYVEVNGLLGILTGWPGDYRVGLRLLVSKERVYTLGDVYKLKR